jgi:hypothetical protein
VEIGRVGVHIRGMKKARVIIETETSYKIVVEQDGHRHTVALAGNPKQAKKYAKEAEIEYGLRKSKNQAKPEK